MKINEFNCISEHNNIDEYLEFYKYVKSNMKEPSWLGEFSLNELKNILNNEGKLFNFYDNNIIVCSMLYIPSNNKTLEKHNLKYDEDLVGSCGPIMVNPEYVGNKFQKQMLELLDKDCKNIGKRYKKPNKKINKRKVIKFILFIIIIYLIFTYLTYNPLKYKLFKDPINNIYGIKKES